MLYSQVRNEVIPSTYHRRPQDIAFESDINKFFGNYPGSGFAQSRNQVEHFDFHFGDKVKLEIKQRDRDFTKDRTQFVPTSKLPKLVTAYESGWYNTLYLQRDINRRYFYFWVSDFTSEDLETIPVFYNPEKKRGSKHNSPVFLIPSEKYTYAERGLEDVLLELIEERRRYVR